MIERFYQFLFSYLVNLLKVDKGKKIRVLLSYTEFCGYMANISELVSEPFPLWLCKVGTLGYRYHQHIPYIYGLCNKGVPPLPAPSARAL